MASRETLKRLSAPEGRKDAAKVYEGLGRFYSLADDQRLAATTHLYPITKELCDARNTEAPSCA